MSKELIIGSHAYLPDGTKVSAEYQRKPRKKTTPGETALHEAEHAVVARANGTGVESVSIVPGPGYLGVTKLSRVDAIAAAAPHSMGRRGTGHDMNIVQFAGMSSEAASMQARIVLMKNQEAVYEVASILEQERTISGWHVDNAILEIERGQNVIIRMERPNGEREEHIETGVKRERLMLPDVEYSPLATAA